MVLRANISLYQHLSVYHLTVLTKRSITF
jgi:hypothetical protein